MATAAQATPATLESLRHDVEVLENSLSDLRARRAGYADALSQLGDERSDLQVSIARGTKPASAMNTLATRIREGETMVSGLDQIIAETQARLDNIYPQLRREQKAQADAVALAEVQGWGAEALAAIAQVAEVLKSASTHMNTFEPARQRLLRAVTNSTNSFPIAASSQKARMLLAQCESKINTELQPILKKLGLLR